MKILNLTTEAYKPRWEKTPDGFLRCPTRVLAERVMKYHVSELGELPPDFPVPEDGFVQVAVKKEEMATPETIRSLEGAPAVAGDHMWLTPDVIKEYGAGHVAGTARLDGDYLACDMLVTDPQAISDIENNLLEEISGGYTADLIFEPGELNGIPYHAEQKNLRFNHNAIIPAGHGRAGADVRILNKKTEEKKEGKIMPVRIQLKNSKRFINVEEEAAEAISEEQDLSGSKLETTMAEMEEAKSELEETQAKVDELSGELSVYKEKLDELLSSTGEEAMENAAAEMVAERDEAEGVVENSVFTNEDGVEDEKKKEEVMNSLKGLWGSKLHERVLNSLGVNTEGMKPEAIRGAFKAQVQITNSTKGRKKTVAGLKMVNKGVEKVIEGVQPPVERSAHQRLGFPAKG